MFRKLVSNLAFSPALLHDVGFYATRLRSEEITRRTTMLFVVLALIMQSLAVFSPPESANASSEQDIIRGGVTNFSDLLVRYDRNDEDLKDILATAGITRTELAAMKPGTIASTDNTYVLTRYGNLSADSKEASMHYERSVGGLGIRYFSPLSDVSSGSIRLNGWIGSSASLGWFGIVQSNGSLATRGLPTFVAPTSSPEIAIQKNISMANLSQNKLALSTATAKPLDKIAYTLKVTNISEAVATAPFSIRLADILEYASVIDTGGGTYETTSTNLSWPSAQLKKGESQERTFVVQIHSKLAATATGTSNPGSYDCLLSPSFGNQLQTPIECPPVKSAESLINELPVAGVTTNLIFAGLLFAVTLYFYTRTRQLKKEIRIIRHDLNAGII